MGARWRKGVKPDALMRTELYLSSGPVIEQFFTLDERQALVLELLEATPNIVAQCQKSDAQVRGLFAGKCKEGAVVVWSVYNARVSSLGAQCLDQSIIALVQALSGEIGEWRSYVESLQADSCRALRER
ncbi:hypothetical protein N018_24185 [Pseudomonas syringae CC1557]|uniref:Uncharacterized protein n=1 Tax=Pseudomonas syringae CC1557 TaxID=1357279 RepID=W0N317_PSESX|nr:hypothetical protein N018_24185 [Pseudomonas syringae CC1557]